MFHITHCSERFSNPRGDAQVCTPEITQAEVFEEVEPVVRASLDGYNSCIFAYGQTGAGKTYTMEGTESDRGIMFRALHALFSDASTGLYGGGSASSFKFTVTLIEVYNDKINDLLAEDSAKVSARTCMHMSTRTVQTPQLRV